MLQQGLEADPPRGKHLLYANRSGANLTLGRKDEALQDANSAAESAPAEFSTAYIRQVHLSPSAFQVGPQPDQHFVWQPVATMHWPYDTRVSKLDFALQGAWIFHERRDINIQAW